MISVLCVQPKSNYYLLPDLDCFDKIKDSYSFTGFNPVICHPPCAQWSRLKRFAVNDKKEKNLAFFCWDKVNQNGGIFEHPAGSSFFKAVGADFSKIISVNQHWWGFPARKTTYLYFHNCAPLAFPLSFDSILRNVENMSPHQRSLMPFSFCSYLVNCILYSYSSI